MTINIQQVILIIFSLLSMIFLGGFAIASLIEKHLRASLFAFIFFLLITGFFIIPIFLNETIQLTILIITTMMLLTAALIFLLPIGKRKYLHKTSTTPIDERDVIFSRSDLVAGSTNFIQYYEKYPEKLENDNLFRKNPGLLSKNSAYFEPLVFSAASANFMTLDLLAKFACGNKAQQKFEDTPQNFSKFVKQLAKLNGALEVGICELNQVYVYSHSGRGATEYGKRINLNHPFAIVMTFEMNEGLIRNNPYPPGILETGHKYVESAKAAVVLAASIRNLGYTATAHFEGHYNVIAPPIARDAGLGEIGRMSLLITPHEGPRVRLSIVTTDLPLTIDIPNEHPDIIDFCLHCKKCANNCPVKAISFDPPKEVNGSKRWIIDADACYRYWTRIGTDCGRCVSVCPYSHSKSILHTMIRKANKRSGAFRRAAILMDDVFYGKYPIQKKPANWHFPTKKNNF